MIVFDELQMDKLLVYDKGINFREKYEEYGQFEMGIRNGDMYSPYIPEEDSLLNSISHFANCIRTKKESISNADQAIRVLTILEKADSELRD
jgi:predicted dehydrogenase